MAHSFRARLTFWNIATLTTAMVLLGGLLIVATQKLTLQSIDQDLVSRVAPMLNVGDPPPNMQRGFGQGQFPNGSNPQGGNPGPDMGDLRPRGNWVARLRQPPIPEDLDETTYDLLLIRKPRVLGLDGRSIIDPAVLDPWDKTAFETAKLGIPQHATIQYKNKDLRVYSAPIRRQNEIVAIAQVATDLKPLANIKSTQLTVLAVLIPVTLLLAGVGATFLTRRALKPIESLTAAAHSLSARDLSQRLPTQGDDEFAQLTDEFNGMISRLQTSFTEKEELLTAQQQFTADASHELRTPLTRIKIITSSTEDDPDIEPELRDRFHTIQVATDHMTALVEQMLTLARTENLKQKPNLQPHALTTVIASAVELAGLNQDPRLKIELKDKKALMNPPLLERALVNLLSNAARHTPEGGTITVKSEERNGQIAITIADTGEGIPAEHLGKITNRFYRVDSARNHATGGTGLGLSIVESIIQAHGGALRIQSESGQGTIATLTIPKA